MKKIARVFISVLTLFLMLCLVIFPDRYVSVAADGIKLWAVAVLPSLFPFFFLTLILTKLGTLANFTRKADGFTKRIFRCNGISAYVFAMSVLSGYPVGAKLISELYAAGKTDKYEATRMAAFCSTSGPLFIVGTVGVNMFGNKICGFLMLIAHVAAALICGVTFRKYGDFKRYIAMLTRGKTEDSILYECIYSSVVSILCVGGFICVFYLLANVLSDFKILLFLNKLLELIFMRSGNAETLSRGFTSGLIECTGGCAILGFSPGALSASLACALVSFGGISVAFQSAIYLTKAKVDMKIFFLSKTLQMAVSFVLCFVLIRIFNVF
ncbi:MAG: hypothetical protein J6Z34_06200 [Clostridia bacterium]|nr:hypothetical protein [Clostridia bacterium]